MESSAQAKENNLQATIKKLDKKYGSSRKVNEKMISKENKLWKQLFTIVLDILKYMKANCKNTEWIDDYYKDKKLDAEKIVSNIAAFTKKYNP